MLPMGDLRKEDSCFCGLGLIATHVQVFDSKNPYLKKSDEYQKQMKNLKWLLGLPFEITVQIDTEHLQFNDAKDDLKDDALKRDAFFASVHTVVALDVCQRMAKGTASPVKASGQCSTVHMTEECTCRCYRSLHVASMCACKVPRPVLEQLGAHCCCVHACVCSLRICWIMCRHVASVVDILSGSYS